ncbi:MAG: pyridoxamine 5-phosphate oxidase family protein [Novosphingobium sp.]|nr:pyridoxamine 5-phosphate oxidase family protein [Novosphingobium sp.]
MAEIKSVERLREIIADYGPRGSAKIYDHLCDQAVAFVRRSPFAMLATEGAYGLEISQKGGDPGFIDVVSDRLLLIPEWTGNHLAIGLQNILREPRVALALILPATDEVLRISGRATLLDDEEICQRLSCDDKPATLIIRIDVERAAFHCVRSARRAKLWDHESWDQPTRISFGKIYADALKKPEIAPLFDKLAAESDAHLY